jgi:hypothetical protein
MPQFVIERDMPGAGALSEDHIREVSLRSLQTLQQMGPQIQWLHSYVINPDHRTHDVRNLFLCDGSSLVTSGRGQPTMTIQALAFRAADRITALARRGDLRS